MLVVAIITILLLVIIQGVRPNRSEYSEFEMRRRVEDKGQARDRLNWRRYEFNADVVTLKRLLVSVLLLLSALLLVAAEGWFWGITFAILLLLVYRRIAAVALIHRPLGRLYAKYEDLILRATEKMSRGLRMISGALETDPEYTISSREELAHLADTAGDILTKDEKLLIKNGLIFADKCVKDYMTPRSVMEAIGCNELLGPLVLDNLHKTGHTHFPVMDGDIDHLVGILHIYSLFTLENKKSLVVKDVMEPRVFYIHEDQTLEDALAACIKYRRHLLVVVNEYRETVGVITIEDAIIQLTGRKIIDQFAEHDNLRAVAERNPRGNNRPKSHVDV